jgi:hypothetical protein
MPEKQQHQVSEIVGQGYAAVWHGQPVRSIGGAIHYFPTELDARIFLRLCDAVGGVPATGPEAPYPPAGETAN